MDYESQLLNEYSEGKSLKQCSRDFDITVDTVKKILTKNRVHIRNRSEQNVYSNAARVDGSVNAKYFNVLNEENVYYMGFLAADGYLPAKKNTVEIGLSSVDEDWLEEYREKISIKNNIRRKTTNNGFSISTVAFSNKNIRNILESYSITPNKTEKQMTMKGIPDKFKLAFIKGYFDGDGSFAWNKNTKQGTFKICSHTDNLLREFKDYLEKEFNINISVYLLKRKKRKLYSLECSTIPSLIILDSFYNDVESPCLKRKYKNYLDFVNFRIETLNPRAKAAFNNKVENMCWTRPEKTGRMKIKL